MVGCCELLNRKRCKNVLASVSYCLLAVTGRMAVGQVRAVLTNNCCNNTPTSSPPADIEGPDLLQLRHQEGCTPVKESWSDFDIWQHLSLLHHWPATAACQGAGHGLSCCQVPPAMAECRLLLIHVCWLHAVCNRRGLCNGCQSTALLGGQQPKAPAVAQMQTATLKKSDQQHGCLSAYQA